MSAENLSPIPHGTIPLCNAVTLVASRAFDVDLSAPVEIWENSETGEMQARHASLENDVAIECLNYGRQFLLRWLRMGIVGALVDNGSVLPPDAWYGAAAHERLVSGKRGDTVLLIALDELSAALSSLEIRPEPSGKSEPEPENEKSQGTINCDKPRHGDLQREVFREIDKLRRLDGPRPSRNSAAKIIVEALKRRGVQVSGSHAKGILTKEGWTN